MHANSKSIKKMLLNVLQKENLLTHFQTALEVKNVAKIFSTQSKTISSTMKKENQKLM